LEKGRPDNVKKHQRTVGPIDIIASNVRGLGASRLVNSLLPAIQRHHADFIDTVWLPETGPLKDYLSQPVPGVRYAIYRRYVPNALSRLAECLGMGAMVYGNRAKLVLGDLPIVCGGKQVVFVHNTFLLPGSYAKNLTSGLYRFLIRSYFRFSLLFAYRIIVQTQVMADRVAQSYPSSRDRIVVIRQPAPDWVLNFPVPERRKIEPQDRLRLFFPSDPSPHKNHDLLTRAADLRGFPETIESISITVSDSEVASGSQLNHIGRLTPEEMRRAYATADALVFPSLEESYGLPLVEAMFLGMPIVCSDRPYARELCGDVAVYFDPCDPQSLVVALADLRDRMSRGYSPDWTEQLAKLPSDWDEVAERMIDVVLK